ncbi:MAG: DUF3298 and DUF4163 domain-containing protein [Asticcacaulis sp.]
MFKVKFSDKAPTLISALALLALAPALSSCKPPANKAETAPASGAEMALTGTQSSDTYKVTFNLPERVRAFPELHSALLAGLKTTNADFIATAEKDHKDFKAEGPSEYPMMAYELDTTYTLEHETPRLLSLAVASYVNTGGAHPNHGTTGYLWDKTTKAPIALKSIFKPGADFNTLEKRLCQEVEAQRSQRLGEPVKQDETFACPKIAESNFVLTPAVDGKTAGGLTFLFSPYEVGSYAEGDYEVTLSADQLKSVLAPAYAPEFGGQPKPRKQPGA